MPNRQLEILPGVAILLDQNARRRVGITKKTLLRNKISDSERHELMERIALDANHQRKYSTLMLDEAAELASRKTIKYAAKKTGINRWSIAAHRKKLMREGRILANGNRKYPVAVLDEAVRLAMEHTTKYAAEKTGINFWVVAKHRKAFGKPPKKSPPSRCKYTLEQKRACVALAEQLINSGETKMVETFGGRAIHGKPVRFKCNKWGNRQKAFIEAGRRLGVNGLSIWWLDDNKMF